jgi:hypothetical protein
VRRLLERVDIVDALSGEAAFAVQVLVHIRDCRGVRIYTRVAGVNRRKVRAMRTRQRNADARLNDSVSLCHSAEGIIVRRAIQRMRDRANE